MSAPFSFRKRRVARRKRFAHALTIEYAIVMMTIVAAFAGLVLTMATVTSGNVSDYRDYVERKAFIDEAADTYIRARAAGEEADLDALYAGNEWNLRFLSTDDTLTVLHGESHATVVLTVRLADADGDGVPEPVMYVYGAA